MPGFEWLGKEEQAAVNEVMERGVLFRYEFAPVRQDAWRVREFENAFCAYTGVKYACAVTSGTTALKVALAALGVGPGDEVITQGFTFVATWEAIFDTGAKPVFAEVDETLCMDPADLEAKISARTKCIIPVHMCGGQARIREILAIAEKHGIPVLEDTAQAVGGRLGGRHLGGFGQVGTASFDAVKTLTTGEGGMVFTNDEALYQNITEYQDHGHDHKPVGRGNEGRRFIGGNYRMMELQGAIGLEQLKKMPAMIQRYQSHKAALKEALARVAGVRFREILDEAGDSATFVSWLHPDRETAAKFAGLLASEGVGPVHWAANTWHCYHEWEHLHNGSSAQKSGWPFKNRVDGDAVYDPGALPKTKEIMSRCLSWQIMLNWDEAHLQKMTEAVNRAAAAM